jgi:hypothetical protein
VVVPGAAVYPGIVVIVGVDRPNEAANTPVLHAAFDQLVGKGRWVPRDGLGSFPVRFPHPDDPGDGGWHVDLSFPVAIAIQTSSTIFRLARERTLRGRALLMLLLFSDIGQHDAPTRIRVGSHMDMARCLEPARDSRMSHMNLDEMSADRPTALATGDAGTVCLGHPFLVHAAQRHRGSIPRCMAQPPLGLREPYRFHREDGIYSPAEISITQALGGGANQPHSGIQLLRSAGCPARARFCESLGGTEARYGASLPRWRLRRDVTWVGVVLIRMIGRLLKKFGPKECRNFLSHAGYAC